VVVVVVAGEVVLVVVDEVAREVVLLEPINHVSHLVKN
jgi:hypothetical protein